MRTSSVQYPRQRGKSTKIFVGGLSRESTDLSLKQYFQKYGSIASAEVLRDHQTMCSRGFGFVTFLSEDVANRIIVAGLSRPHTIDGKQVEVKVAVPKEGVATRRDSTKPRSARHSFSAGQNSLIRSHSLEEPTFFGLDLEKAFTDTSPTSVSTYSSRSRSSEYNNIPLTRQSSLPIVSTNNMGSKEVVANKIFVGGLLYSTGHERLRNYFQRFGEIMTAEVIYNRETKKSRGFGFVVFTHSTPLKKIMELQEMEALVIDGKQIEVKLCKPKEPVYQEEKAQDYSFMLVDELTKDLGLSFDSSLSSSPFECDRRNSNVGMGMERGYSMGAFDDSRFDNFSFSYDLPGKLTSIYERN